MSLSILQGRNTRFLMKDFAKISLIIKTEVKSNRFNRGIRVCQHVSSLFYPGMQPILRRRTADILLKPFSKVWFAHGTELA